MRRLLILIHRYLGIPLSVMFVVWFVSGIVMIYTGGLPAVSQEERLARMAPIDAGRIRVSAADAWSGAEMTGSPEGVVLRTMLGRPVYRFAMPFGRETLIFADDGEVLAEVSEQAAAREASRYLDLPPEQLGFVRTLSAPDQWTLAQRNDLPLHLFFANDARATQVYVSLNSGEVALTTTRAGRFFAWIGVIPHWLYFTPLRLNQPVWYWSVVVLSALGCLLAAIGLTLAFVQFRPSHPFSIERSIRYRGWMRWHYISGALFGVFTLTWVFSGLLSMEPFEWTTATGLDVPSSALRGGELDIDAFPSTDSASEFGRLLSEARAVEVEFAQVLGQPFLAVSRAPYDLPMRAQESGADRERLNQPYPLDLGRPGERILISAESFTRAERFESDMLVRAMQEAAGGAAATSVELLEDYDAYYYSRNGDAPLPVLRVKFDDPMATWYYVDPAEARVVARTHRYSRIERWLFNGLHSLDFAFWYDKRPLWDIGMIALSIGALLTSAIGMILGFRRLLPLRGNDDEKQ